MISISSAAWLRIGVLLLLVISNSATAASHSKRSVSKTSFKQRATQQEQDDIYALAFTDPVLAAKAAVAMPYIAGQSGTGNLPQYSVATSDEGQLPWNAGVAYITAASVNGSDADGWQSLPEIAGMTLNRTMTIGDSGSVMPFYSSAAYDATRIKRAILIMPGKPRDCWKYTSLVQNALAVQLANTSSTVTADEVLIWGPCWMNSNDHSAGAVADGELYWTGSTWQRGHTSSGPGDTSLSSYEVLDYMLDTLFDTAQFPALQTAVLAGHSMGAQLVQRYSVLKQQAVYDDNVSYWIGNPGSYVWLDGDLPYSNTSCEKSDNWPYGLDGSNLPKYARDRIKNDKQTILHTFQTRNVHYNLGLLDNGAGDTSCKAQLQGSNHLERGALFIESLASLYGSFPASHTVNFMPNVSHQDYAMLSYNISLYRLFDEPASSTSLSISTSTSSATLSSATISSNSRYSGLRTSAAAHATPFSTELALSLAVVTLACLLLS